MRFPEFLFFRELVVRLDDSMSLESARESFARIAASVSGNGAFPRSSRDSRGANFFAAPGLDESMMPGPFLEILESFATMAAKRSQTAVACRSTRDSRKEEFLWLDERCAMGTVRRPRFASLQRYTPPATQLRCAPYSAAFADAAFGAFTPPRLKIASISAAL